MPASHDHRPTNRRRALWALVSILACKPEPTDSPDSPPHAACEGVDALAQAWTDERRASLDEALSQLPGEWPTQALETLDARVAAGEVSWREAYEGACRTNQTRAQRCLDMQVWELDALVGLLIEQPARAAVLWPQIDPVLREVAACSTRDEPNDDPPALPPKTGAQLATLELLLDVGELEGAAALLTALEGAPLVQESPVYALRLHLSQAVIASARADAAALGTALDDAEQAAAALGPRARMSVAAVRSRLAFAANDGAAGVTALGEALAAARDQDDEWLVYAQLRNLGVAHVALHDYAKAVEFLTQAVALSARLGGAESPHTARVQVPLALAQRGLGQIEAAHDLLTQARDSFVNALGPDHPSTLEVVEEIGRLLVAADQPFDANYAFLDLLEIYGELYGPKHWRTATVKLELGDTLMAMEQHDGARTMYMEALTPLVQSFGADHRDVIRASIHLGIAQLALGELDEAEVHCKRGIDLVKALAPDDPLAAEVARCVEELAAARKRSKKKR